MRVESAELAVRMAVCERFETDKESGVERTLEDYQGMFPGFDSVVETEFRRLVGARIDVPPPEMGGHPARIGPYRIERELGRGGQGAVYLAVDERLGRRVALKTLTAPWAASAPVLLRLGQEARVLASLDHPGICPMYEAGNEGGLPFFAMRYVEGETLAARLGRRAGPPDGAGIAASVALIERIARATHAAHESGVIHRDLKPANVMIGPEDQPVILDFGLAHAAGEAGIELTASGDLLGTPHYMSPEQAAGDVRAIDRRSDVHALGVLLFESVTGVRPYLADSRAALLEAIRTAPPPDARRRNPRVSADLGVVIATALAKSPADRYATALLLAEDLRRVRHFEPIQARPIPWTGRLVRFARRRPAIAALVAVLALGVPTIGAFTAWYLANRPLVLAQREARLHDEVEHWLELGFNGLPGDDVRLALPAFEAAARILPSSIEAAAGIAIVHLRDNRAQLALETLDRFRAAHGDSPIVERLRSDALRRLGCTEEAETLVDRLPLPKDHLSCFIEGVREVNAAQMGVGGAYERAVEWFWKAKERAPRNRRMYHRSFCEAVGLTRHDMLARWAAETAPVIISGWAGHASAGFALLTVDPKAALDAFERASRMNPEFHYEYGVMMTYERQGRLEDAARAAQHLTARKPDDATAFLNLAVLERDRARIPESLAAARRAVALRPDLADMQLVLGIALMQSEDRDGARAALAKALELEPQRAIAHFQMSEFLLTTGESVTAESEARQAIELDARMIEAHWVLGMALFLQKRMAESLEVFEEAMARSSRTLKVIVDYAERFETWNPRMALGMLGLATKIAPPEGIPADLRTRCDGVRSRCQSALEEERIK